MKHFRLCLMMIASIMLAGVMPAFARQANLLSPEQQRAVEIVSTGDYFADWLAEHPGWRAEVSSDDNSNFYMDFYTPDGDWLGGANVNIDTGEITDAFAPLPLDPDVYQEQLPIVDALVMSDPEITARLGVPALWDKYIDYNRYDQIWEVYFSRGLESLVVTVTAGGDNYSIESFGDQYALDTEQARQSAMDTAISLAYNASGVDRALDGFDDWRTYVTAEDGSQWSVMFATLDQSLFYVLVDIDNGEIIESRVMR